MLHHWLTIRAQTAPPTDPPGWGLLEVPFVLVAAGVGLFVTFGILYLIRRTRQE